MALSDSELAIIAAYAKRHAIRRSDVFHHMIARLVLFGDDFVQTGRFLALPPAERVKVTALALKRLEEEG